MSPPKFFFENFDAKSRVWGQFGSENKLIEGQPNEYDVICWNASVLAFHLWPAIFAERRSGSKIFAGAAFHRVPAPVHPWLYGEDLLCYSNKNKSVSLRKCPYDR